MRSGSLEGEVSTDLSRIAGKTPLVLRFPLTLFPSADTVLAPESRKSPRNPRIYKLTHWPSGYSGAVT